MVMQEMQVVINAYTIEDDELEPTADTLVGDEHVPKQQIKIARPKVTTPCWYMRLHHKTNARFIWKFKKF